MRRLVGTELMRLLQIMSLLCFVAFPLQGQQTTLDLPNVTTFECPTYPPKAESARLQGVVVMQVTTNGHAVSDVKIISGHPILVPDAFKNVHTWKFADHAPTTFRVDYYYVFEGHFKRDKASGCDAKMELPSKVTVSTKMPSLY